MEKLLQAPTDGVGDAIVVPPVLASQFDLKIGLLNLFTVILFHGFENNAPHSHIRSWRKFIDEKYSRSFNDNRNTESRASKLQENKPKFASGQVVAPPKMLLLSLLLSRLNKEKFQDKSDIQVHKFLQMFKKLHFNISLAEALALMPKYAKMLKDLLSDKEKLLGLALRLGRDLLSDKEKTSRIRANSSLTVIAQRPSLEKLPEKLWRPRKNFIL
ncbi:hypothetical protein Tco_1539137 [Tanacetum coccineum]